MAFELPRPIDPTQMMQDNLRQRMAVLAGPNASADLGQIIGQGVGGLSEAAIAGYMEKKKKATLAQAMQDASAYLSTPPEMRTPEMSARANQGFMLLGITPPDLKRASEPSMAQIEGEAAARARGTASVPKPPSSAQPGKSLEERVAEAKALSAARAQGANSQRPIAPGGGGKMLPAPSVLALNEGKNVARLLPEVESAIKENAGLFGPAAGRVASANPYDTKAQTVEARMRSASQAFGKFMEGGVLRKEDEDKYRKMFPQLSDGSPEIAQNKLSIISRQLAQKFEDDKATLGGSGYDVSGFGTLEIPASLFGETKAATPGAGGAIALTGDKAKRLAELRARAGNK